MDGKVRDWLQQEESSIPHRSAHRKPTDIYSIRGGSSEGPPMHISIAPDHQNPSIKRYPKAFSSSDSSLIPFAEPKAIAVARVIEFNNSLRDDRRHVYATASETPEREGFPRIDDRRTKDFQQRPRHKMRGSREKKAVVYPEEKKKRASVNKKPPKAAHSKGDALINGFSADNLTKDRLTLRPSHRFGIFKKGRASNPVKKGLPDLAFSEMKFLDGKYCNPIIDETATSKCKRDCRGQRAENEISSYFGSSKRCPHDIKLDTMTTPSQNYTKSRKRLREESHSPGARSSEPLIPASPSRSSPRSAMAEALRRKGVYSLPANLSSRESNNNSNIIQATVAGGYSDGDADDHSEYSRKGFQTRFKADVRGPVNLYKRRNDKSTTHSSTDGHSISHLELVNDKGDCRLKEEYTNTVVGAKEVKANTKNTAKQVSDAPEPILTDKKPHTSRGRRTPEPFGVRKTPDSSSPLTALLRVCADSPIVPAAHEKHIFAGGQKIRKDAQTTKIAATHCDYWEQCQLLQDYQQRPDRVFGPLNEPEVKPPPRFGLVGQDWNDPKPGNWDVLPEDLCAVYEENPLCAEQQGEVGRGCDQIIHCHSNDRVSDSHIFGRAAYDQNLNSMLQTICDDRLLEFESENPGLARPEWVHEIPDEYICEDSRFGFVDDLSAGVPPDYASDGHYTRRHEGEDWSERRQTVDLGQSCAMADQQQAADIGHYPIRSDGYEYSGHNEYELERGTGLPGPTRDRFWRRHRLG